MRRGSARRSSAASAGSTRVIQIAWRAQRRLYQRYRVLRDERHKPAGVATNGRARELLSFIWGAARLDYRTAFIAR